MRRVITFCADAVFCKPLPSRRNNGIVEFVGVLQNQCFRRHIEAVVVENSKWHVLFTTEEIARALKRLRDYGYEPRLLRAP
jgi:hypothetical protein